MPNDIEARVQRAFNAAFYRCVLGAVIGLAIALLLFAVMH